MQRPAERFTGSDRQQVAAAVAAAESQTSAEIVPVIAAASGRYDRAEDLVGLWTAVALMALFGRFGASSFPSPTDGTTHRTNGS